MYNYNTAQQPFIGAPTVLARLITSITYPQQFVNRQSAQIFNHFISHYCADSTNRKKNKKTFTKPLDKNVPLWYNKYRKRERETLDRKRDNNYERIHPHTAH